MAVLVAALIDQGKALSDKRNDASVPDTDWLLYANRAVERLWKLITSLDPHLYFAQSDFTLVGGASGNTKDLTTLTRFRALHGLDLNPDTNTRRTVPRRPFRERNVYAVGWWTPTALLATDRAYDVRGMTLAVNPYETASGNYRAYYRQGPYQFTATNDATPMDAVLEPHVEYVELLMGRRGLGLEESDGGRYSAELAELTAAITSSYERDDGEPDRIADAEGQGPWGWP